jgi:hypothetical protein
MQRNDMLDKGTIADISLMACINATLQGLGDVPQVHSNQSHAILTREGLNESVADLSSGASNENGAIGHGGSSLLSRKRFIVLPSSTILALWPIQNN